MSNAKNMENNENREETVLTESRKKWKKQYESIMKTNTNSDYVVFGDGSTENTLNPSDVKVWAEAAVYPYFKVRALQNKENISPLKWDATGNKANLKRGGSIWERVGVSCAEDNECVNPEIYVAFDEDTLLNYWGHGNTYFKAIMVKAEYSVVVPAFSKVQFKVSMNLHFYKKGGETSASYIGGVISSIDTWTPVTKQRKNDWADNNGVIQSANSDDCTVKSGNSKNVDFHLGINDYDCGWKENDTDTALVWTKTFYIMCSVEKANSIHHRLLMFDRKEDKWQTELTGTSTIYYDPNGGQMESTEQTVMFSAEQYSETILYTAQRQGYILSGWYDRLSDRYYAPGGIFTEHRGVRLVAQWMPGQAVYTVNHFFQNVDGSYSDTPDSTEQYTGTTDENVIAEVKTAKGFSSPTSNNVVIHGDDSTVVNYYYARKVYTITFLANGGAFRSGGDMIEQEVEYGADGSQISYPRIEPREGYSFKWSETLSEMPAHDVTVRAVWTETK